MRQGNDAALGEAIFSSLGDRRGRQHCLGQRGSRYNRRGLPGGLSDRVKLAKAPGIARGEPDRVKTRSEAISSTDYSNDS